MKNNTDAINALLDTITNLVISCNEGDVMTISEIITNFEKLAAFCTGSESENRIGTSLLAISRQALTDNTDNFIPVISAGIDLLRDALETEGELPSWKKKRIGDWLAGISTQKSGAAGQTTAPPTPIQPTKKEDPAEDASLIDPDQLKLFISDSEERFARAQELILILEKETEDQESVKELFRIFHTIKGECGFLKLASLGFLTHNVENLLDLLRSSKLTVNKQVIDFLLRGLDLGQELLDGLKSGSFMVYGKIPVEDYVTALTRFTGSVKPTLGSIMIENGNISEEDLSDIIREQINDGFEKKIGQVAVEKNYISRDELTTSLEKQRKYETELTGERKDVAGEAAGFGERTKRKTDATDTVIKVKTAKVNYLVDMIGELLISLGQMREDTEGLAQVRKIARTLQYAGMQLRTESVHVLFGTVRRIIRDTANKLGKQVQTVFVGDDLEIDRTLIESLEEPLMHLVRNSLDHGIESTEERIRAGKPTEGTIRVSAERRGNNIVISVGDDGGGLNCTKILEKAVAKGLIRESDIQDMSETAIFNLIFTSGFSTKENVDLVSGRGVGMDIVKEAVTKAKGQIRIESTSGKGSTFSLFFPLSTAIIDGMTVRTGENIFIIPITAIVESLKLTNTQVHKVATGVHVLDLRGEMIPIISLAEAFGIQDAGPGLMATIVENANKERFAITSDEILAKREVVIKTLGARFRDLKGISSGTVLAGGTIGFVLDIEQFIELGKEDQKAPEVFCV